MLGTQSFLKVRKAVVVYSKPRNPLKENNPSIFRQGEKVAMKCICKAEQYLDLDQVSLTSVWTVLERRERRHTCPLSSKGTGIRRSGCPRSGFAHNHFAVRGTRRNHEEDVFAEVRQSVDQAGTGFARRGSKTIFGYGARPWRIPGCRNFRPRTRSRSVAGSSPPNDASYRRGSCSWFTNP